MFFFGSPLGKKIYGSADVGHYLRCFAPLVPIMYCDMITDGCLKGLGQHMKAMYINIAEASLNVMLLYFLIPRFAITGYGLSIYICEGFNFILSFARLLRVADVNVSLFDGARIVLSIVISSKLALLAPGPGLVFSIVLAVFLYFVILCLFKVISKGDIMWFRGLIPKRKPAR